MQDHDIRLTTEEAAACARIRAACRLTPNETIVDAARVVEVLAGGGSFYKDGRLHALHEGVLEASRKNGEMARRHADQMQKLLIEHDRVVSALHKEVARLAALCARCGFLP